MPNWDSYKADIEKGIRDKYRDKCTNVGKNNRLGEILQFICSSEGWTTIKLLAEHFGWTEQEAADKLCRYKKSGYIQVSDHVKTERRPLSIYTITDEGFKILGSYMNRTGG